MTHKSGHVIISAMETQIPKTPIKVRDIVGLAVGIVGGWWFF